MMTREEILAEATEIHDSYGCSCDRKYLMSCPNLAQAILEVKHEKRTLGRTDLDSRSSE